MQHWVGQCSSRALTAATYTGSPGPGAPSGFYCCSTDSPSSPSSDLQASETSPLTMTPAFSVRQPPTAEHLVLVQEETEKINATTDNKKDTLTLEAQIV